MQIVYIMQACRKGEAGGADAPPDFQTLRHACVENLSNDADVNDQEK